MTAFDAKTPARREACGVGGGYGTELDYSDMIVGQGASGKTQCPSSSCPPLVVPQLKEGGISEDHGERSVVPVASPPASSFPLEAARRGNDGDDDDDHRGSGCEEEASHGDDGEGAVPPVLLLRHRMGYSIVKLTKEQRATFTRHDLESFLLYKEQKYNAVNALSRFCVGLLLMTTLSSLCLLFSVFSPNWQVVRYDGGAQTIGLLFACRQHVLQQCVYRTSALFARAVVDTATGLTVCSVSEAQAKRYAGAMWAVEILHVLGQLLVLCLTMYIACRPTRSKALVWVVWILLGCTAAGVANSVVFPAYVRCDRLTCSARHQSSNKAACERYYGWGYHSYIAVAALQAFCGLIAFAMYSYVVQIRVKAQVQLREERRRKAVEKAAEHFVRSILEERGAKGGPSSMDATTRGELGNNPLAGSGRASLPWQSQQQQQRAINSVTVRRHGDPYSRRRSSDSGYILQHTEGHLTAPQGRGRRSLNGTLSGGDGGRPPGKPPHNGSMVGLRVSLASSRQGSFVYVSEMQSPDTARNPNSHSHVTAPASHREEKSPLWRQEPLVLRKARQERKRLESIFRRDYDPSYLTAAELGVTIAGASDWVYDDRSDMYYSFERNLFWDPLTDEYFNCALRTWQENPDTIVDVRDAMQYAWEGPSGSDSDDPTTDAANPPR